MIVIPAIDLRQGRCVRLLQGRAEEETVYGDDPLAMARRFDEAGARLLHLVDLDGAFAGECRQQELIRRVAGHVSCPVQVGGGLRTLADIAGYLEHGVERAVIGTAAIENPALVRDALAEYGPDRVALAVDVRDELVAVRGWGELSDRPFIEVVAELAALGVEWLIFTAIARDGTLQGPDFDSLAILVDCFPGSIVASGGVSRPADLDRLEELDVAGAIVGRAFYEGTVPLTAIARSRGSR